MRRWAFVYGQIEERDWSADGGDQEIGAGSEFGMRGSRSTSAIKSANRCCGNGLMAALSGFFGVLAAVLATIGLYGVISLYGARRRKRDGIHALGANQGRVCGAWFCGKRGCYC